MLFLHPSPFFYEYDVAPRGVVRQAHSFLRSPWFRGGARERPRAAADDVLQSGGQWRHTHSVLQSVPSSKPERRRMKTNTAGDTERHPSAAVMLVGTVRTVSATMPALNSGKLGCY